MSDIDASEKGGMAPSNPSWATRLNPLKRGRKPPIPSERAVSPEYRAGFFSLLTFEWMSPLMFVGYQRPLEINDIPRVNPNRTTPIIAARLQEAFDRRVERGSNRPLALAIFDTFRTETYIGGAGCLTATLVQTLMPFVLKYLITLVTEAYFADKMGANGPAIGIGIGWALGISGMQILGSIGNNHFMYRGMLVGGQVRSALTSLIFNKAMTMSGRAKAGWKPPQEPPAHIKPGSDDEKKWYADRMEAQLKTQGWSNGRIITLMSTDTNRIDKASGWFHMVWTSPVAMLLTIALLLINLTYSALPGIGLFLVSIPIMGLAFRAMFSNRTKINTLTDKRVTLTQEVLHAIRFVKYYAWEMDFLDRIAKIRWKEIRTIQILLTIRSAINAISISVPLFASMLAFITFSLTRHPLDPAPIFSSLTLFNQLRLPLMMFPMVTGLVTDALAAINRIEQFLLSEDQSNDIEQVEGCTNAVELYHADFTWERVAESDAAEDDFEETSEQKEKTSKQDSKEAKKRDKTGKDVKKGEGKADSNSDVVSHVREEPFMITDLNIQIGRKEFIAIFGGVGSGKSSLLAALAGDMRKTSGSAIIGGSKAYCPQNAWMQNATLQDNIIFGKELDEARFNEVLEACSLRQDLDILPRGRFTEIGERGINLSGGQKQRVNLARAIYSDADIMLMDDPLSAVDAHVGRHILEHALCGVLKEKCRILATHQLHVLHRCDRIIMMDDGKIVACDTFDDLMTHNERFRTMMAAVDRDQDVNAEQPPTDHSADVTRSNAVDDSKDSLMQVEDRGQEGVSLSIYHLYFKAAGSILVLPLVLFLLMTSQGGNVVTNLWLAWWSSDKFAFSTGKYIGVYTALGIAQSVLLFGFSLSLSLAGTEASKKLLHRAIHRVLRAPMSFFDTTPLGRIMNRFSKDIDTLDNNLTDTMRIASLTIAQVVSVFILIIAYYYYFAAALGPLFIVYLSVAAYYQASARELQRHEAVLRSVVFARFNEAIFGTATIRAYGLREKFLGKINDAVDDMDSAYFLTFANQRWLSVRLDAVGTIVVFVTEMLVVTSRFDISPSISGLILSYLLSIVQLLQFTVRQAADVENNMHSTERIYNYGHLVEQEAPAHTIPVADDWPQKGEIVFHNVHMRYRPQLPLALEGLDMHIRPGERIGVVGRTGAGKSSIIATLFRMVELGEGKIEIDGIDISTLGLQDLRSRMSIIPQDPSLFAGTVRSNLDPFNIHTDLELWSALRQAHLVDINDGSNSDSSTEETTQSHITLETIVEEEGRNFSLGQKQLLVFARALVRGSQIIVCDEATSSIDFETDRKIQKAISDGFHGRTMLCVAHRLKTIISYDRICVIDRGQVAEVDTPLALYDAGGMFRSMCEQSSITRETIIVAGDT